MTAPWGPPPPEGYGPPPGNGPAPGDGTPPAFQGYGYPPGPQMAGTNGFAIASLVCSLAGLVVGVTAILGVVFGHIARGQIKQTGQGGGGLALAGLIIGYVLVAVFVAGLLLFGLFVASFSNG